MKDHDPEDYEGFADGRRGADRMALGLSIIPDKNRGDMDTVAVLRTENQRLQAEMVELRKDHERIDCMERNKWGLDVNSRGEFVILPFPHGVEVATGPTLRSAIDNAASKP